MSTTTSIIKKCSSNLCATLAKMEITINWYYPLTVTFVPRQFHFISYFMSSGRIRAINSFCAFNDLKKK